MTPPQGFWFSLRWGSIICISSKFPGDADANGQAIKLTNTSHVSIQHSLFPIPSIVQGFSVWLLRAQCHLALYLPQHFLGHCQQRTNDNVIAFWVKDSRCYTSSLPMFLMFSFLPVLPVLSSISKFISKIAGWIGRMGCFSHLFFFIPAKCWLI